MTKRKLDLRPKDGSEVHLAPGAPLSLREREEIVDHAVRWTRNILSEVLHNHGIHIRDDKAKAVREAVRALSEI